MEIDTNLIKVIAPGVKEPEVVAQKLNQFLPQYGINTPLRVLHFMSQVAHESEFNPVSENLNYSAEGLLRVFPKYFPSAGLARSYARKPVAIANRVYGNRYGNGNEASGDGWLFRGRGYLQLTFKGNYQTYGKALGYDLVNNPDFALQHGMSTLIACEYFKQRKILPFCDSNDMMSITKCVNGGLNGYGDRVYRFNKGFQYLKSLGVF